MLTNQPSTRINLKRLGDKLPDLIGYFLPLVSGESPLCISGNDDRKVVAHFSPTGLWNSRTFPTLQSDTCDTWTLQRGIFSGKDSYKNHCYYYVINFESEFSTKSNLIIPFCRQS